MDSRSNAASVRQAANRTLNALAWLVIAVAALAWGGRAQAQSCDFVSVGETNVSGPAGSQVSFTLRAEVACTPTVDVVLAITADTTGGASIDVTTTPTLTLDTDYTFTVTLGPTPDAVPAPSQATLRADRSARRARCSSPSAPMPRW